jgi:hypothetical protein
MFLKYSSPQRPRSRRKGTVRRALTFNALCVLRASAVSFLFGQFKTLLLYRDQFAIAMFDGFAGEFHSCLSGQNEAVAENVRPR